MSDQYDLVVTSVLPNLDTDFFEPSNNYKLYVNLVYGSTGKFLGITTAYSEDLLTKVDRMTFSSREVITEFESDPTVINEKARGREYNLANGITTSGLIEPTPPKVL